MPKPYSKVGPGATPIMEALHPMAASEMNGHLSLYADDYVSTQYLDIATDDEIDAFLEEGSLYSDDSSEWIGVPSPETEQNLYSSIKKLVASILSKLGKPAPDGISTREACWTEYRQLFHVEESLTNSAGEPVTASSTPALVIKASGPSFQNPPSFDGEEVPFGYTNVASCFHVMLDDDLVEDDVYYAVQSSIFARQIFLQQPNRRFVRNLLITEETCRLYHFDRSGGQYTAPFSIHQYPEVLIRLILGLSSPNEEVLGLDTSVQWTVIDGRKVSGAITVIDTEGASTTYPLRELQPIFYRSEIVSRGTTGWLATTPGGREVFIKDSWRMEKTHPEYTTLSGAIGVDGAAQMHNYEAREVTTASLRSNGSSSWSSPGFKNYTSTRLVLDAYGKPLQFFQSQKQFVAALRDIIAAHCVLVHERDVLHRDISPSNILLGRNGAKIGQRGWLIDFEMGIKGPRPLTQSPSDTKHGTHFFMSIPLLHSYASVFESYPAHDQFDDLESIYYVLLRTMCTFTGIGEQLPELPEEFAWWEELPPGRCAPLKGSHWVMEPLEGCATPTSFWLPATRKLLTGFYTALRDVVTKKIRMRRAVQTDEGKLELKALLETSPAVYAEILARFDSALDELEVEEPEDKAPPQGMAVDEPSPSASPSEHPRTPNSNPESGSSKRSRPCEPDDGSRAKKRARVAAAASSYSPPRTRSQTEAQRLIEEEARVGAGPRTRSQARAALVPAPPPPPPHNRQRRRPSTAAAAALSRTQSRPTAKASKKTRRT